MLSVLLDLQGHRSGSSNFTGSVDALVARVASAPGQLQGSGFPAPFGLAFPYSHVSSLVLLRSWWWGYFYPALQVDFMGHREKQEVWATSPSRVVHMGGVGGAGGQPGLCSAWRSGREQHALCPEWSGPKGRQPSPASRRRGEGRVKPADPPEGPLRVQEQMGSWRGSVESKPT